MSNVMNVPDHIAERIRQRNESGKKSAVAGAIVGNSGEGSSIPRISIRSSRYRLVESGVETVVGTTLDVVIVGANPRVSKVFYGRAYDGENTAPDCFSTDGVKPHASVENPVCASCAGCPNNELGSKILPSGSKSKLCADQRHLAVVAAADPSKVYSLTIPVSAMRGLREYFKELGNYGLTPEEVVTELGFDDEASYPRIQFKHKGYVPETKLDALERLTEHDSVKIATRQIEPSTTLQAPKAETKLEAKEEVAKEPPAPKKKPKVEPIKASDDLANSIADLFDE